MGRRRGRDAQCRPTDRDICGVLLLEWIVPPVTFCFSGFSGLVCFRFFILEFFVFKHSSCYCFRVGDVLSALTLTATCGQVTAADFISHARCEFAVFAGGRKYAMRADTKFELDMWLEVCNRHGRMWLTDLSV